MFFSVLQKKKKPYNLIGTNCNKGKRNLSDYKTSGWSNACTGASFHTRCAPL